MRGQLGRDTWYQIKHGGMEKKIYEVMYWSNGNFNIPPGNPPGIWNFEVWVVQIPIPRVKTGVQMPHLKVILGDQMPLPPGQTWQKWAMEQKYICFHEKIIFMSFETRNIEVVLYNLLKNVQCTLIINLHTHGKLNISPTKRSMGNKHVFLQKY